jgi:hypothetical protein
MEMGDPKLLKKYYAFSEAYKVEYAFEGVVEKFDTIDTIDPERLTRGLYVSSERGTRLVSLDSKRKPPVEIGETVIVVGSDRRPEKDEVQSAIILIPKGHYALFSSDIRAISPRDELISTIPMIIGGCLFIIPIFFLPADYSWLILVGLFLYCVTPLLNLIFPNHFRQPKLYKCDEKTWLALLKEAESMYNVTPTTET